jgi:hypothetical protein
MTDRGAAADETDGRLGTLCSSWRDLQQLRISFSQRGLAPFAAELLKVEKSIGTKVTRELKAQPVWPWLAKLPGLRGVHVARLVAIIGDPRRFPGQGCTEGHAFVPDFALGDQCANLLGPEAIRCEGRVVARAGTGVRSLWRYLGLDVVDGRSPRKRKGQQGHWHMEGRSAVLMPGGIGDSIVRLNVEPYVSIYRAQKARLIRERAVIGGATEGTDGPLALSGEAPVDKPPASERVAGERLSEGPDADGSGGTDNSAGLRPFQIDALARKIAAKAFVGDLLIAMKAALLPVARRVEIEDRRGWQESTTGASEADVRHAIERSTGPLAPRRKKVAA